MAERCVPRQASSLLVQLGAAPRPLRVVSRTLWVLIVAVVAFMFLPWQQVAPATGRVIAYAPADRQQDVQAPIGGRVVKLWVRDGQVVKEGEPLVDISDVDPLIMQRLELERSAVEARQAAARSRVESDEARVEALEQSRRAAVESAQNRVRMAEERLKAAVHAEEAAVAARETADLNLARQKGLFADGLASRRALELAELDATRTRTDVDRAGASVRAATNELDALRQDATKVDRDASASVSAARVALASARAEAASAQGEMARLQVRMARQESQRVLAPREGQVLKVLVGQGGELVKQGDVLATLVPLTSDRAVELWVDGLDAPLVQVGNHARLQFDGWPAVQFMGWPSVAVGTFGGRVAFVDAAAENNGKLRILLTRDDVDDPWPDARYLRQGVRANGWVFLNRVTVGFELWRLINGFPPSITAPDGAASGKDGKGGKS